MAKIISKGEKSINAINGSSTQVSGANATIHIGERLKDIEGFYNGDRIKAIDIIKSQRAVIEKLQHQIDRMQNQFDTTQEIKNKLVVMLMQLLNEHNNKQNA